MLRGGSSHSSKPNRWCYRWHCLCLHRLDPVCSQGFWSSYYHLDFQLFLRARFTHSAPHMACGQLLGINKVKREKQWAAWSPVHATPLLFLLLRSPNAACYWLHPPPLGCCLLDEHFLDHCQLHFLVFAKQGSSELVVDPGFLPSYKRPFYFSPKRPQFLTITQEPYWLSGKWLRWRVRPYLHGKDNDGVLAKYQAFSASTSEAIQKLGTFICLPSSSWIWRSASSARVGIQFLFYFSSPSLSHITSISF